MRWRRGRTYARWILILTALTLLFAEGSCWWIEIAWTNPRSSARISLGGGGVYWGWMGGGVDDFECEWQPGLRVERAYHLRMQERFPESDFSGPAFAWRPFARFEIDKLRISAGQVFIPLWIPFVGLFPPAGLLCGLHVRGRRRGRAGRCKACDYDRSGLAEVVCPECGAFPTPSRNSP